MIEKYFSKIRSVSRYMFLAGPDKRVLRFNTQPEVNVSMLKVLYVRK